MITHEQLTELGVYFYDNYLWFDKDGAFYILKEGKVYLHDPDRVADISIGIDDVEKLKQFHLLLTGVELI